MRRPHRTPEPGARCNNREPKVELAPDHLPAADMADVLALGGAQATVPSVRVGRLRRIPSDALGSYIASLWHDGDDETRPLTNRRLTRRMRLPSGTPRWRPSDIQPHQLALHLPTRPPRGHRIPPASGVVRARPAAAFAYGLLTGSQEALPPRSVIRPLTCTFIGSGGRI